ncbi:MAG TPA: CHAT domain-containing tetratricopeptide repeat protein, partial [Pyrinomonadaceae bacterium]|nr:CHAT domain-containing tetratricopeptide repeat protein [Pyrinomonadaceae bacterium]
DYRQALEDNQKSLRLAEELGYKHLEAYVLQNMGDNYLKLAQYASALEFAERSSTLAHSSELGDIYWRARTTAGQARLALGQIDLAREDLREAISAIEKLRGQVAGGEQDLSLFFADKVSPYYSMVDLLVAQSKPFEALTFAERAKGRVLLDVLSSTRSRVTKGMTVDEVERDHGLTAEMKTLSTQLSRLKLQDKPDEAQVAALTGRLEQARRDYESFQTNLYILHPELKVQRGQTRPLTPDEARALLPDGQTALLEYAISEDKLYLFVMTSGAGQTRDSAVNLTVHPLHVTAGELAELAKSFRRGVAERDLMIKGPARRLYDLLIAPAESRLRGIKKLCIVPDGSLWELPFQALYHDGQGYLLERYAIYYAPSLSVLREMNRRGAQLKAAHDRQNPNAAVGPRAKADGAPQTRADLLALGNPSLSDWTKAKAVPVRGDGALAPLPDAEREVKALGQLYGANKSRVLTGPGAREEVVKSEAGGYLILHFATHAILDDNNPMYSYIMLSHATGEDGLLEAGEIARLDLNAEMVVLSGCQTARGRVAAGEG